MKKIVLGVAAMVCGIALAEESYLYWQINQQGAEKPIEFAYAQVKATKDGGDIYVGEAMGVTGGGTAISAGPIDSAFDAATYGEDSGYSFVVELMNSEFDVIGESETFGYAAIARYIWSPMGQKGESAWTVTTFNAVPEPTSGLLLLLGVAGLALRRKVREVREV